jgi:hypothetical protein
MFAQGPFVDDDNRDPNCLIVIVDADDLRAEGIELSPPSLVGKDI